MPRTRIVCTLGPAVDSPDVLRALIRSGMNVARLNFSHGTIDDRTRRVELVRRLADEEKAVVALLGDLQGPKLRIGEIPGGERLIAAGEIVVLTGSLPRDPEEIPVNVPSLGKLVESAAAARSNQSSDATPRAGPRILLDDGAIELVVEKARDDHVSARVLNGGVLKSHKGVNLPGVPLPFPSLAEKDLLDLEWAIEQGLDYLALSFVRRAEDIKELRQRLQARQADIPIIAKIEKSEAVGAFDEILLAADGIMVARGDLGVELPAEQVPVYQKQIIRKANALGKPVITATQMLESMIEHARPTRAEASDVANAILDGTDAVMLSAETSIGKFPVEAVRAMARIAAEAEKSLPSDLGRFDPTAHGLSVTDAIGQATVEIACQVDARLIITLTSSGYTARMVARHRAETPMLAATTRESTRRNLALVWGAASALIPELSNIEEAITAALQMARQNGFVTSGDRVVLTAGVPPGVSGRTNMIQVRRIE